MPYYQPLTIFGHMVLDHMVHSRYPHESGQLKGVALDWDPISGRIIIPDRAYISTPYIDPPRAVRLVFELPPGEYKTGGRCDARNVETVPYEDAPTSLSAANLSQFTFPRARPGGGGTNVSYALYNIFGNIQKHYISICSKELVNQLIDAFISVFPPEGLVLLAKDPGHPVNLVIEGIAADRFIVRSPRKKDLRPDYYPLSGDVCMVNTCSSWFFAINALVEAMRAECGGVVACTQALCDTTTIPEPIGLELASVAQNKLGGSAYRTVSSIHAFVRDVVMKGSTKLVYVFNEEELAHFVAETRVNFDVLDLDRDAIFSGIVRALIWLRGIQGGLKPDVVVTLGKHGALYLDGSDNLHYCRPITETEMQRVSGPKNAIGDLFAAVLLGVLYGRGDRGVVDIFDLDGHKITESHVPSVLVAASAAADVGVYDGFMAVMPSNVSSLILKKTEHYAFFGPISRMDPSEYAGKIKDVLEKRMDRLRKGVIREPRPLSELVDPTLLTP